MPDCDSIPAEVEYRDIPGFTGYRVGSDGSVWGRKKRGSNSIGHLYAEWHLLRTGMTWDGYKYVNLSENGRSRCRRVHALVLTAFHGPPAVGQQCRHLNDIRADNRASNLRWGTAQENADDKTSRGRQARGETCARSRLKTEQAIEIRRRRAAGESGTALALEFGVAPSAVCAIHRGKTWKHV